MRRVHGLRAVVIVALVTSLAGCSWSASSGEDEAPTPGRFAAATSTSTPRPTATPTNDMTTPLARPTVTRQPTTAPRLASPTPDPTLLVQVLPYVDASALPGICTPERVQAIFEGFVNAFNAEDIDGVLRHIQPDWSMADTLDSEAGQIPLKWFAMVGPNDDGVSAFTHAEIRDYLPGRFAQDERLRLTRALIGPSWDVRTQPVKYSERNADFGIELERWNAERAPHPLSGKGVVDCQSGTIVQLGVGYGTL